MMIQRTVWTILGGQVIRSKERLWGERVTPEMVVPDGHAVVYGLFTGTDREVRYVGQTTQPPYDRYKQHLATARNNGTQPRDAYVRACLSAGTPPVMRILKIVAASERWNAESAYIAAARTAGHRLTNVSLMESVLYDATQMFEEGRTAGQHDNDSGQGQGEKNGFASLLALIVVIQAIIAAIVAIIRVIQTFQDGFQEAWPFRRRLSDQRPSE